MAWVALLWCHWCCSPHRRAEGSHRNDLTAAAQPHPPGEFPEAYRAAARPDWDRQSHSTWQGKCLCLVFRAFIGFISKEVPLKRGFAIAAPLVYGTAVKASCNCLLVNAMDDGIITLVILRGIDQKCFCLTSGCSFMFPVQILGILGCGALCVSGNRCVVLEIHSQLCLCLPGAASENGGMARATALGSAAVGASVLQEFVQFLPGFLFLCF